MSNKMPVYSKFSVNWMHAGGGRHYATLLNQMHQILLRQTHPSRPKQPKTKQTHNKPPQANRNHAKPTPPTKHAPRQRAPPPEGRMATTL